MNYSQYLTAAGVPAHLHAEAIANLDEAHQRSSGLALAKWKVRLFKAGKISRMLAWGDERLIAVQPDLADWDIAPMVNITAHGDNVPWPDGRPVPGAWLDDTPEARAANYWCNGEHPRSRKSRKAWYRRNAGEYRAWRLGAPVDLTQPVQVWRGNGATVRRHNGAWMLIARDKWLGLVPVCVRIGYEIDNVIGDDGTQYWYPIPGCVLRAPVTWSVLPTLGRIAD